MFRGSLVRNVSVMNTKERFLHTRIYVSMGLFEQSLGQAE